MDNIKEHVDKYVALQKPVPLHGLYINPIMVKDFFQFNEAKDILRIEKNKIPNVEIIQMTYLRFLLMIILEEESLKEEPLEIVQVETKEKNAKETKNDANSLKKSAKKDKK